MIYEPENLKNKRAIYEKRDKWLIRLAFLFWAVLLFIYVNIVIPYVKSTIGFLGIIVGGIAVITIVYFFTVFFVLMRRGRQFRKMNNDMVREYHENKNIRLSGSYKNSLQDGEWKSYLEDGTLETIINYKDGELNGLKEDYYKNGNVWTRQEFKNNDLDGVYEVYYENGNPQLKAKIKNGQTVEELRFNHDGTPYNEEKKIIINDTASSDEITIKEVSDDEIVISESSVDFSKELEKGMETLGKKVGNSLSFMLEATVITNLAYVDLMSFENIEILEENLVFNEDEKVPFKRSHKNGVYGVNIPFENNTYLWVELKENTEGKHRLFAQSYEKFRKMGDDTKGKLEEFIFSWIDDYYRGNNKVQKFFDITLSVKNHS